VTRPKRKRRKEPPPPEGGKALERLHQFEQERGLEETQIKNPKPDRSLDEEGEGRPDDEEGEGRPDENS
jgi:hypothetical protein